MRILPILLAALLTSTLPLAAQDLPPGTMILTEDVLPEYESTIDHAKLIDPKKLRDSIKQGEKVYHQVCFNCHGDRTIPGSLPNSLRFAEGKFQHGKDPYTMYQTLTRGWRLMPPQVQLTPREKYAVIHYIREEIVGKYNEDEYFEVSDDYLDKLPKGDQIGPEPVRRREWTDMDYGPFLIGSFEIADEEKRKHPWPKGKKSDYVSPDANIAHKAIAIRLDSGVGGISKGKAWVAFEHDTMRIAGAWTGEGFIDWHAIYFDGRHVDRPRTIGDPIFETDNVPGWANPKTGKFKDERFIGMDGRRFGPLPRDWMHYKGLYKHGNRIVISYTVGKASILESHDLAEGGGIIRTLNIGKSSKNLILRLANKGVKASVTGSGSSVVQIRESDGFVTAIIPANATPLKLAFVIGGKQKGPVDVLDLSRFTHGGPAQWPETVDTAFVRGKQEGGFQWDSYSIPIDNPWKSRMRSSGVDFTPDGKAAIICCWDGDVWHVDGITDEKADTVKWRRIASGLFQPLGVKLVNGEIFVTCRDQLVRLIDLNGDSETDFYEAFNSDHQVTEHFHEFAMGLQADDEGNFYYAKSARHARTQLVAHHGTLLKVSADGSKTEIIANGFRAANGVCINPDGTFYVTDQEGHWNPQNRINWVKPSGRFYGNMWSYGAPDDESDSAMEQPLCWITKGYDRSPAELLWVDSEKWGSLNGKLLNISYGLGRLEIIPHEFIKGQPQGGVTRLPIPDFPTGIMRGRFHPDDGHLYICGLAAWSTSRMQMPGGFYRVRATGKPMHLPVELNATKKGVKITFSDPLDPTSVRSGRYAVKSWALKRSKNYGSKHYDTREHKISNPRLSKDGTVISLDIEDMGPVWQMEIRYEVKGKNGEDIKAMIHNTIHHLGSL